MSEEPPSGVSALTETSSASGTVTIAWTCVFNDAATCSGGSNVTSFQVSLTPGAPTAITPPAPGTARYSVNVPNLSPATSYVATVAACNAIKCGPTSSTAATPPVGPPGAPSVSGSASGASSINWSWGPPANLGNQKSVCYNVSGAWTATCTPSTSITTTPGCSQSQSLTVTAVGSPIAIAGPAASSGNVGTAACPPPTVALSVGGAHTYTTTAPFAGHYAAVTVSNFPANSPITMTCFFGDGSSTSQPSAAYPGPAWHSTDGSGNASWNYSGTVGQDCWAFGTTMQITISAGGVSATSAVVGGF